MEPLAVGAVHCWIVPPAIVKAKRLHGAGILARDEEARAARFRFDRDRRLYVASHTALRLLLSRYTGRAPGSLDIAVDATGRPALTGDLARLQFNLSHSDEMALVAVAMDDPVGVDVERVRQLSDLPAIAEKYFAPGERGTLRQLSPDRQCDAFTVMWTRKEAIVKALGLGLHARLDSFETGPVERPAQIAGEGPRWQNWTVVDLVPAPEYVGAVAIQRPDASLVVREFTFTV